MTRLFVAVLAFSFITLSASAADRKSLRQSLQTQLSEISASMVEPMARKAIELERIKSGAFRDDTITDVAIDPNTYRDVPAATNNKEAQLEAFRAELKKLLTDKNGDSFARLAVADLSGGHLNDFFGFPLKRISQGGYSSSSFALTMYAILGLGQWMGVSEHNDPALITMSYPWMAAFVANLGLLATPKNSTLRRAGEIAVQVGGVATAAYFGHDLYSHYMAGDLYWLHGLVEAPAALGLVVGTLGAVPAYGWNRLQRRAVSVLRDNFWSSVENKYNELAQGVRAISPNTTVHTVESQRAIADLRAEIAAIASGQCAPQLVAAGQ